MRRLIFSILALVLIPSGVFGAEPAFRYGSVQVQGGNDISVSHSTLQERSSYECTLSPFVCGQAASSTPIFGLPELPYDLNTAGTMALVSEASSTPGRYVHTIYAISEGTAQAKQVLPFSERISSVRWSENGQRLSFIGRATGAAVLLDIPTNSLVQIVTLPGTGVSFSTLSSTGRYLAMYAYGTTDAPVRQHYLIDFETGKTYATAQEKLAYWDLLTEENRLYSFSPDDRYLAYLDYRDGHQKPWFVELAKLKGTTFRGEALTAKRYTVGDFIFADNDNLIFAANRAGPLTWDLWNYRLSTGVLNRIASKASYFPSLKRTGEYVFYNVLTARGSEPRAYHVPTRTVREFPPGFAVANQPAGAGEVLRFGQAYGVLFKPPGYSAQRSYPLVVWLHGGPHRQTSAGYHPYPSYGNYDWILEEMRRNGALVLKLDYTGSYGYGRTFAEALRGNVGKKDVADVLAAVAGTKSRSKVSGVHLMGTSYGGYLALRTLVERPASFKGVISVNGVTDWQSLVQNDPASIFRTHFNGSPKASNQRLYDQASVADRIDRLTTQKVLLAHGTADGSVPQWQSGLLNEMLTTIERDVQFVSYEGEDHVYAKRENVEDLCRRAGEMVLGTAPACSLFPAETQVQP